MRLGGKGRNGEKGADMGEELGMAWKRKETRQAFGMHGEIALQGSGLGRKKGGLGRKVKGEEEGERWEKN